jgi:hypothetical protein
MSNEPRFTSDVGSYPRQSPQGRPERGGRRRTLMVVAVSVSGALLAGGLLVGAGLVVAVGLNVMGDEWVCSDGEAPGGIPGSYSNCYVEGSTLPAGVTWDPFGNRPMPYNCDKDGWVAIERSVTHAGVADDERDCVREGTDLPGRWHITDDS